ncbi:PadR family transcriptional regulator [Abyssisolibacter fermentans]|uniref:PadR family transcriptional regulator n=1 Tax=Abyssisolibacter fermentans TaxID=1766203 RepID=UPI00082CB218|nr:PadR family transcriptional regulator [Abyssisolibacter fermentans]
MDKAQLLKGILDGCILQIIQCKETYGYKITEELNEKGFYDLNEGTVYPILVRLEKKGLITSASRVSPLGPRRKYFKLSEEGQIYLDEFKKLWHGIKGAVNTILEEGDKDE